MPAKSSPRRRRRQYFGASYFGPSYFAPLSGRKPPQQAAASFSAGSDMPMNAFVVRASKTKHGIRSSGRLQYAQLAIAALYPMALPQRLNTYTLTDKVNALLAKNPGYRAAYGERKLARMTVTRALERLRANF
jgi:hypothetical protein